MVQGPMPGSSASRAAISPGSAPGSRVSRPLAVAAASPRRVALAGGGEPEAGQVGLGQHVRAREDHAQRGGPPAGGAAGRWPGGPSVGPVGGQRGAVPSGQAARERARRGDRDLLPEDRAHGQLETVVGAGHPQPGPGPHQRGEQVVGGQRGTDRGRVGVGVEQPPGPADHRADRPEPAEPGPEQHVPLTRPGEELDDPRARGGLHGPGVAVLR